MQPSLEYAHTGNQTPYWQMQVVVDPDSRAGMSKELQVLEVHLELLHFSTCFGPLSFGYNRLPGDSLLTLALSYSHDVN
jgi:hypothetical protein